MDLIKMHLRMTISPTYVFTEHVVGLQTWVLAIVIGSDFPVGPAAFQTTTGPRIVVVLAELLHQRVQVIIQVHVVGVDGIGHILRLVGRAHLAAIVILVRVLGQTVVRGQGASDGDQTGQCFTEQFRVIVHIAERVKNVREQQHRQALLLIR